MYCLTLEQGKTLAVPGLVTLGEAMPKENEEIEGEIMISMLDSHLLNHPYVESDADVRVAVESAIDSLARAYQLIGKDAK